MTSLSLVKSIFTSGDYYVSMNNALKAINGDYHMLHYPLHQPETRTFAEAQENLIHFCIERLPELEGKQILDIGCGNGVVALYLAEKYNFGRIQGIDLNPNNIEIAHKEKKRRNIESADFLIDNAQELQHIKSASVDVVINIESAFHYPDKVEFLKAVQRVLKPGQHFVIADILTTRKRKRFLSKWKKKMKYHHWSYEDYVEGFREAGLTVKTEHDISEDVIKGYQVYKRYLEDFKPDSYLVGVMLKIFFVVNVKLNTYLLRKKRKYFVFYGTR